MLVLTRGYLESIIAGSNIKFTILEIRRGQVKIGVTAPKHIPIHREEIWNKIKDAESVQNNKMPTEG